jgi:basic membrane protein A
MEEEKMSKKIYSLLAIVLLASMVLAACGGGAGDDVFRVGFVTDSGGINDDSFNETQWNGILKAAEENADIEAQFIQSDEATQYEPNLTEFASQGYDLVVAAGFLLTSDLAKVAVAYPDHPQCEGIGLQDR